MPNTLRVSLVIPCFNAGATLRSCLQSVFQGPLDGIEVVLVDDNSTDDSIEIAGQFPVRIIKNPRRLGPSSCRNVGLQNCAADLVMFLDSDVELPPKTLDRALTHMDLNPQVGAFTSLLAADSPQQNFFSRYKNIYMNYTFKQIEGPVRFLYGSFCGLRKSTGFQWPADLSWGEDTWLGNSMAEAGIEIHLLHQAEVIHHKTLSFRSLLHNDFRVPFGFARTLVARLQTSQHPLRNFSHTHPRQLISLSLIGALTLASLVSVGFAQSHLLWVLLPGFVFWYFVNQRWFEFVRRHGDLNFFRAAVAFTLLDQLTMGLGAFFGLIYFGAKKILNPRSEKVSFEGDHISHELS